jgi:adenylosuccinate synthase
MPADIILGLQWGDEGKGKVVDLISKDYDIVVRYQGGANAGHTVVINNKKYILHLIPSGIFTESKICVIGNGTVIDPEALIEEINYLKNLNIDIKDRVFISSDAHLILPYHKFIDSYNEDNFTKIGTTKRGIGPAYIDKYNRCGIKIDDLKNTVILKEKIIYNIKLKINQYPNIEELNQINIGNLINKFIDYSEVINPLVINSVYYLNNSLKTEKNILLEGAQGCLLDVDFGSYPFVTSSHPTTGGALTGSGIPANQIRKVIGVTKGYATRVGEGPFPTELINETGQRIRDIGNEYGATTARPRRCGWLDLVALNYSCMLNGVTELALTKIDVLNDFDEIFICTGYELNGEITEKFITNPIELAKVKPVYKKIKGWKCGSNCTEEYLFSNPDFNEYLSLIENSVNCKIKYVSVGADREQTLTLN